MTEPIADATNITSPMRDTREGADKAPRTPTAIARLREYLEERPALAAVIREAGRKLRSYSGLSGEVALTSPKAVAAVRGIGAKLHARDTRVRLTALDEALRHLTVFACSLRDAVDAISETPLVLRSEEELWRGAALRWFDTTLRERCQELGPYALDVLRQWTAHDLGRCKVLVDDAMASVPVDELKRGLPDLARLEMLPTFRDLWLAFQAIVTSHTSKHPVLLPVLAERLTGDPHALDADRSAGRVLLGILAQFAEQLTTDCGVAGGDQVAEEAHRRGRVAPALMSNGPALMFGHSEAAPAGFSADERAALYAANNMAIDAISSTVAVWNVLGGGPVLHAARAVGIPVVLPLMAIDELPDEDPVQAAFGLLWVVENPAVFQAIVAAMRGRPVDERPTVLCGSGFLSLAALRLIDRFAASEARVLYSGDWDTNGLTIAAGVQNRWLTARLWRMDLSRHPNDPNETLAPDDMPWGDAAHAQSIAPCAWEMVRATPRYQEAWITTLIADVNAAIERLAPSGSAALTEA